MEPSVIYEDEALLVLNKPAGWLVHAAPRQSAGPVLAKWLLERYPGLAAVGEPQRLADGSLAARPGIVHRLDKNTSGVLVVAKTPAALLGLREQFRRGEIKKEYRALVYGLVPVTKGKIDLPIGRRPNDSRRLASRQARGRLRSALTEYQVLKRWPGYSYLAVFPRTGRTHQIRVHLLALGHPVVADELYAPGRTGALPFKRQALHALSLELAQPITGARLKLAADLPADFKAALAQLDRAC